MAKPLAGVRVIELANFIAGPLAGTLLADMGADVLKVEPPQGDMGRATPPIRDGVNLIIEAFSGALSVTGEPGKMPMRPGVQTADVFGALFAAYATLAGLVGAARNGEGRIADVSLVEASIAAAAWEVAEYLETGNVPQPLGNRHRLNAPYQLFETKTAAISRSERPTMGCSPGSCRSSISTRMQAIRAFP